MCRIRLVHDLQAALLGDIGLDARALTIAPIFEQVDCIALEQQGDVCDDMLVPMRSLVEAVVDRAYGFVPECSDLLCRLLEFGGHLVGW
jgi:hypothetical protein